MPHQITCISFASLLEFRWTTENVQHMRITRFPDIGSPIPIFAEITEEFSMPINHLSKVMGKLTRTGWVHALRGRNGGHLPGTDTQTLHIETVLRELECNPELINCER
jgi:DNA-binding IscR family transcriptional regulator